MTCSKAKLPLAQQGCDVFLEAITDHSLKEFAQDREKRDRTVISRITLGFLFVESHNISDFPFLWENSEFQRQMKNMCERYIQRVGRILEKESRDSFRFFFGG